MSTDILRIFLFSSMLLATCWMMAEYWLSVKDRNAGREKLRFGSRTAIALSHFWKAVEDARDIPGDTLKEEMERYPDGSSSGAGRAGRKR